MEVCGELPRRARGHADEDACAGGPTCCSTHGAALRGRARPAAAPAARRRGRHGHRGAVLR
eukprot:13099589-Heterocapsa_arctica.AAC.1